MKKNKGFTLVELMVTAAIIAIIAAIAIPQYSNYITRTNRNAAQSCMIELSQYMERFYSENMNYAETEDGDDNVIPNTECQRNLTDAYAFEVDFDANTYTISATPQGRQASKDDCGVLSVAHTGAKSITGDVEESKCWK